MSGENASITRGEKLDEISRRVVSNDDICSHIYVILLREKSLRFNELHRYLRKLGTSISKPSLLAHLNHLKDKQLIQRKEIGTQHVEYTLPEDHITLFDVSEQIADFMDMITKNKFFKKIIDAKVYYKNLSDKDLETTVDYDLNRVLEVALHEFQAFVTYDLKIDEHESSTAFWKFIGNPLYRIQERSVADHCRASDAYREKFFRKINRLIKEVKGGLVIGKF
jgi:DNA-binding HxlR family transcriptional regulator